MFLTLYSQAVVGLSVPLWDIVSERNKDKAKSTSKRKLLISHWAPATLLGMAMVARGEIGLLIIQLGLNDTSSLSEEAFLVAVWGIVVNTIIGPVFVGLLLHRFDKAISENPRWGLQVLLSDITMPHGLAGDLAEDNDRTVQLDRGTPGQST